MAIYRQAQQETRPGASSNKLSLRKPWPAIGLSGLVPRKLPHEKLTCLLKRHSLNILPAREPPLVISYPLSLPCCLFLSFLYPSFPSSSHLFYLHSLRYLDPSLSLCSISILQRQQLFVPCWTQTLIYSHRYCMCNVNMAVAVDIRRWWIIPAWFRAESQVEVTNLNKWGNNIGLVRKVIGIVPRCQ